VESGGVSAKTRSKTERFGIVIEGVSMRKSTKDEIQNERPGIEIEGNSLRRSVAGGRGGPRQNRESCPSRKYFIICT